MFRKRSWKPVTMTSMFLMIVLSSCGVTDPIEMVKGGTLNFDSTVKIGNAIEGCKAFKNVTWFSDIDSQQRTIVYAKCVPNDQLVNDVLSEGSNVKLDNSSILIGFALNADNRTVLWKSLRIVADMHERMFNMITSDRTYDKLIILPFSGACDYEFVGKGRIENDGAFILGKIWANDLDAESFAMLLLLHKSE